MLRVKSITVTGGQRVASIINQLFKCKEVRDTLFALAWVRNELEDAMLANLIHQEVKNIVISNPKLVKKSIHVNREIPMTVALGIYESKCFRDLSSGMFHSYRGVLDMHGLALRSIWERLQNIKLDNKLITHDQVNESRNELARRIRSVG